MRLIATEEAFAPRAFLDELVKLADTRDDAGYRYLRVMYRHPELRQRLTDVDLRLAEMDEYGVDMHLLGLATPGVQAFGPDLGTALAARANDELAAAVARHPTRFAGLAAVGPQAPERAAAEIERGMTKLGLHGVIINSHTGGEYLDNAKFFPVLEAAEALGAPVYLHPTFPADDMIGPYSDYGMMGALWGFGAEASLHIVRVVLAGVFDRFPALQVVLGHLGEGLPFWLDRLDNRYRNLLRRGGLEPLGMRALDRLPSEYFRTNISVTTAGMNSPGPIRFVLDTLGEDRVMFAIDYPHESTGDAVPLFRSLRLPQSTLEKVASTNAERLFGIAPG